MTNTTEQHLDLLLVPLRTRLQTHPLYTHLRDAETLRLFMAAHVFAVWDFQSLLKALQRLVTCVEVPWLPTADPEARRLLNEIVLDEESDQVPGGGYMSHFELYLQAMNECGADVTPIETFVGHLRGGRTVEEALATTALPPGVGSFVCTTMTMARLAEPHRVAAAFAFGREEIIPTMFHQVVEQLAALAPQSWQTFRYYLSRHLQVDADHHGPQARLLVRRLCGHDARRWGEAVEVAQTALEARDRLWNEILRTLRSKEEGRGR